MYFRNCRLWKFFLDHSLKSSVSETRFDSQRVKASQMFAKSPWERSYHVLHHSWGAWFWKRLPQCHVNSRGFFFTHWLPMASYPVQGCENLQLPIQIQLSEQQKTFPQFFVWFQYSASNFEHFERKDERDS